MGWMKAIATDAEDLRDTVLTSDPETLADNIRGTGWVSPTEAFLVSSLLKDVLASGTVNLPVAATLQRVLGIIGG